MDDDSSYDQYQKSVKHCTGLPVKPTAVSWACTEVIRCWEQNLLHSDKVNDMTLSCAEILQKMYELNSAKALAGYLVTEL